MRFKIVSAGWQCAQFMERTLKSVERQTLTNWDIGIAYDPSDDNGAEIITEWCAKDPKHRLFSINTEKKFAIRNHYEMITRLDPEDDDVVIFLDLDGDQLAFPEVLERLRDAYEDGALVTYGQYRPIPDQGTNVLAKPYPPEVIANNSYRKHHLNFGDTCFNHLRTISGRVFKSIPESMFRWPIGGNKNLPNGLFSWEKNDWYQGSTDYVFMISALERAGGRVKCFDEVLLLYNHANPLADNMTHPQEAETCIRNFFSRPPLPPLGAVVTSEPERVRVVSDRPYSTGPDLFLQAEERRHILSKYGKEWGLNVFIETGTNRGETPEALMHQFRDLYTIELDKRMWQIACGLFEGTNVRCLYGDSAEVLPQILQEITEPALVWLDGHYSGPGTAHGTISTPIRDELKILLSDGRPHVILVDDARIFEGGPEHNMYDHYAAYPSLEWVEEYARSFGYDFILQDDIMRLTP